ncbi:hypothetical protein K440DRAFT_228810 [Wilcoxina mikolae CBS 423.85]|nr:hypothetical protein K440DRAFT_228810 [Wilcoxina mikolae CBS 423.85]
MIDNSDEVNRQTHYLDNNTCIGEPPDNEPPDGAENMAGTSSCGAIAAIQVMTYSTHGPSRRLQADISTYSYSLNPSSDPEVIFYGEGGPTDEMIRKIEDTANFFCHQFPLLYLRTRWEILPPPEIHAWPDAAVHRDFCLTYRAVCDCDCEDRVTWSSASPPHEVQENWVSHILNHHWKESLRAGPEPPFMLERYLGAPECDDYFARRVLPRPDIISESFEIMSIQDSVNTAEASEEPPPITDDEMQSVSSGGSEPADASPGAFLDAPCAPGGTQPGGNMLRSAVAAFNSPEGVGTRTGSVGGSRDLPAIQLRQFPLHDNGQRGEGTFQCTFCTKRIANKYNWIEHEEAHLELSTWVCAPQGFIDPETGLCVYCEEENCHKECHKECESNRSGRTFTRKKYFQAHLRDAHKPSKRTNFNHWKTSVVPPKGSRCGFCDKTFTDWKERMKHVGHELESGLEMGQWNGDWGLAEEWMVILRNDTTIVLPGNSSDVAAPPPAGVYATQRPGNSSSIWIQLTSANF